MVKGRGKGSEYSGVAAGREDGGAVRKRGRPLKLLKEEDDDDDMYAYAQEEDDASDKIGDEDGGVEDRMYVDNYVPRTDLKNRVVVAAAAAKKKRKKKKKRAVNIAKKKLDLVVKEDDDLEDVEQDKPHVMKLVELKQIGSSRRKSKPHRAAEVGVECL